MSCPFCDPRQWEVFYQDELVLGLWNAYPVAPGHVLLVTRRHVDDWFAATPAEQAALTASIPRARLAIETRHRPDGYNIGLNCGEAAGQTVFHLHLHVLPRYLQQRPVEEAETRMLMPSVTPPHLQISNFSATLGQLLETAQVFDCAAADPTILLLIWEGVAAMVARGGRVRLVSRMPLPSGLPARVDPNLNFTAYRVVDEHGPETSWIGSGDWHYALLPGRDRHGQRELRKALEETFRPGAGE